MQQGAEVVVAVPLGAPRQAHHSSTPAPTIRKLDKDQVSCIVASAARAFHDDPLFNFFEPDLCKQLVALPPRMRAHIMDALPLGETYAAYVDGKAKAVAAWQPPGTYPLSPRREFMFYMRTLRAIVKIGRRIPAALRLQAALDKAHPKMKHWHLDLLAVDPLLQGQGVGTALLQPIHERCDREGLPAYVETQTQSNVAWYGRFGYKVVQEIRIASEPDMPPMWTLIRPPNPC